MRRLVLLILTAAAAFSVFSGQALAVENIVGQVDEFDVAAGTRPEALTAGPDGNLWFAGVGYRDGQFTDVVGKVTPKGKVTEYVLDAHPGNLGLSDIVAGPDGNLWFGEYEGDKVGRITPSGSITEFPLADSSHITAGPDGALWLTGATKIYRLATDGSAVTYPLPAAIEYPNEIVAGPDGALWFGLQSRFGAGAVPGLGRIDTDGQVSEVVVPGGRQTFALSDGPYDDIWYSNGGGRIGWMIPGLVTGEPACINSCRAPIADLTEGPDGKLWFAAGVEPMTPSDAPGTVGTYAPPPIEIRVVADGQLRGDELVLPLRCRWTPLSGRCRGEVRLRAAGTFSRRRVQMLVGRRLQVHLSLPGAVRRALARKGRISVQAATRVAGGKPDTRRIVLRRP